MSKYRFVAVNAEGKRIEGERDAPTVDALTTALTAEGLQIEQIDYVGPANVPPSPTTQSSERHKPVRDSASSTGKLPSAEAQVILQRVAETTEAGLPLVGALRAMAEEFRSQKLRRQLLEMCRILEAGGTVEESLSSAVLPPHLTALIRAGTASGKLGPLLDGYLTSSRKAAACRRAAWISLSYPVLLVVAVFGLLVGLMVIVVPQFARIFQDFGTELPGITQGVLGIADLTVVLGWWIPVLLLFCLGLAVGLTELAGGRRFRRQFVCSIPGLGGLLRMASLSEFSSLLGLLLEARVPLPEALELAGQQAHDVEIYEATRVVAAEVSLGADMPAIAVSSLPQGLPHGLRHIFGLMDSPSGVPERLRAAGEMFSARAEVQSTTLPQILEPLIIVFVAISFGVVILALFMPLLKLLNDLS